MKLNILPQPPSFEKKKHYEINESWAKAHLARSCALPGMSRQNRSLSLNVVLQQKKFLLVYVNLHCLRHALILTLEHAVPSSDVHLA